MPSERIELVIRTQVIAFRASNCLKNLRSCENLLYTCVIKNYAFTLKLINTNKPHFKKKNKTKRNK